MIGSTRTLVCAAGMISPKHFTLAEKPTLAGSESDPMSPHKSRRRLAVKSRAIFFRRLVSGTYMTITIPEGLVYRVSMYGPEINFWAEILRSSEVTR